MTDQIQINITNRSGQAQGYFLVAGPANVSGSGGQYPRVRSNVFAGGKSTSNNATEIMTVSKNYSAVVGTFPSPPAEAAKVDISGMVPVTLGVMNEGSLIPGTSLVMDTIPGNRPGERVPVFPNYDNPERSAGLNCFSVETRQFKDSEKTSNRFMLGIGASANGKSPAPLASFMAELGVTYRIQPSSVYYVIFMTRDNFRSLMPWTLVDGDRLGPPRVRMDFAKLPSTVSILHTAAGQLVFHAGPDPSWK